MTTDVTKMIGMIEIGFVAGHTTWPAIEKSLIGSHHP